MSSPRAGDPGGVSAVSMDRGWANLLLSSLDDNNAKEETPEAFEERLEKSVRAQTRSLLASRGKDTSSAHASLAVIPSFYRRANSAAVPTNSQNELTEEEYLDQRDLLTARAIHTTRARDRFVRRRTALMPNQEHLEALFDLLSKAGKKDPASPGEGSADGTTPSASHSPTFIDWSVFSTLGESAPSTLRSFFTASVFLRFRRDALGRIDTDDFLQYVVARTFQASRRLELASRGLAWGDGKLDVSELIDHVDRLVPTLRFGVCDLQPTERPYYVHTAVRKLFFMLDPKRTGRVSARDLFTSPAYMELMILQRHDFPPELITASNWFSVEKFSRVYALFLTLDEDRNGLLSRYEFSQFEGGNSVTPIVVDRLYQDPFFLDESRHIAPFRGELDFKNFLDFVLAFENKRSEAALAYFWRILDIDQKGYLDAYTIDVFFRQVRECIATKGAPNRAPPTPPPPPPSQYAAAPEDDDPLPSDAPETMDEGGGERFGRFRSGAEAEANDDSSDDQNDDDVYSGGMPPTFLDIKDEIFDLVRPAQPSRITYKDLVAAGPSAFSVVITMLTDPAGFIMYDNRENVIASEVRDEIAKRERDLLAEQDDGHLWADALEGDVGIPEHPDDV